MEYCMVCERIDWIKNGKNPYFVKELNTGYVVIGDHQRIKGYSLFLCKEHATELHFLEPDFRAFQQELYKAKDAFSPVASRRDGCADCPERKDADSAESLASPACLRFCGGWLTITEK